MLGLWNNGGALETTVVFWTNGGAMKQFWCSMKRDFNYAHYIS
jgi:hypothetical protein